MAGRLNFLTHRQVNHSLALVRNYLEILSQFKYWSLSPKMVDTSKGTSHKRSCCIIESSRRLSRQNCVKGIGTFRKEDYVYGRTGIRCWIS